MFHDPVRDGTGWVHGAPRTPTAPFCALTTLLDGCYLSFVRQRVAPTAAPDTGSPGKPSRFSARPLHPSPGVHGAPVLTAHLAARLPTCCCEVTRLVAGVGVRFLQRLPLHSTATPASSG